MIAQTDLMISTDKEGLTEAGLSGCISKLNY